MEHSKEDKALAQILKVVSDITLDPEQIGRALALSRGPAKDRLGVVIESAGYKKRDQSEPEREQESLND